MINTKSGDSTLVNTYDNERPPFFTVTKSKFKGDLVAALKLLGEGDSASFKLNLDSLAKYNDQPKPVAAQNNYATITVKIEKVLHKVTNETDSAFEDKKRDFYKAEYETLVKRNKANEASKIAKYIADNELKMNTTPSGLNYLIERAGNTERAAAADTIMVDYTGQFTNKKADGKLNVFDTSNAKVAKDAGIYSPSAQYAARPLVLNQLPNGFAEGVKLIGVGGKIKIIIPSKLGYGENGGGSINPFTPLVFDIELKSIVKANSENAMVAPAR
ncbi:MAG: peptidylprolyl isomerase [Pedobacter sp.]|nr:MAG: peptidylprolyl isomerase [Pedobacter sp.]